jgi:hypothetical protein
MASSFHSGTHVKVVAAVSDFVSALGTDVHFDNTPGFRLHFEVGLDGRTVSLRADAPVGPNNPFAVATTDNTTPPALPNGGPIRQPTHVIDAAEMP